MAAPASEPQECFVGFGTGRLTAEPRRPTGTLGAMEAGADGEELLHVRTYDVAVYRHSPTVMRVRGSLRDECPDGLAWLPEDTEPLVIHHMVVDLFVELPSQQIVDVRVVMDTKPNLDCATILPSYDQLIGLSVARGFSHKVKELFGGPRACTHITILLQAMAPAVFQAMWRMSEPAPGEAGVAVSTREARELAHFARNRNTCHVWADGGLMAERLAEGVPIPPPIWGEERLRKLGVPLSVWHERQ